MYQVHADGVCFYSDIAPSLEFKVIDPKLTLEINNAGTLTFTIPPTNVCYSSEYLKKLTSKIVVYRNDRNELKEIWEGRVISEKQDFWNNRVITCEGELAYLNDTVQPQAVLSGNTTKQYLEHIISNHNSRVSSDKQFTIGTVTAGPSGTKTWEIDYDTTMKFLSDLVDEYDGVFKIRKSGGTRYLDYVDLDKKLETLNNDTNKTPLVASSASAMTNQNRIYVYTGNEIGYTNNAVYYYDGSKWVTTQLIAFGENLIDFTRDWDLTEFVTAILPLGKRLNSGLSENIKEYTNVSGLSDSQVDGKYVKNTTAVTNYGWIAKAVKFDDIEDKNKLLSESKKYLSDYQFDNMTIEVKVFDLHYNDSEAEMFKMYDNIHVVSVPHGLDRWFPVTKMEIPLGEPSNTTITLSKSDRQKLSTIVKKYYNY